MELTHQSALQPEPAQQSGNQPDNEDSRIKPGFFTLSRNTLSQPINRRIHNRVLHDSVLEGMKEVKLNKANLFPDEYYKSMGVPVPAQYEAFNELYEIGDKDYFTSHRKEYYNHFYPPTYPCTLKLLKDVYDHFNQDPVRNITITCGSFWRKKLWVRREIIQYLNLLSARGVTIDFYTNCGENEEYINELHNRETIFHNLDNRVMIHFTCIDDKYILFEYPHTEQYYLRLNMLLSPKDFKKPPLKDKRTEMFQFFGKLIERAKES